MNKIQTFDIRWPADMLVFTLDFSRKNPNHLSCQFLDLIFDLFIKFNSKYLYRRNHL